MPDFFTHVPCVPCNSTGPEGLGTFQVTFRTSLWSLRASQDYNQRSVSKNWELYGQRNYFRTGLLELFTSNYTTGERWSQRSGFKSEVLLQTMWPQQVP
jgi:hypothetical protein